MKEFKGTKGPWIAHIESDSIWVIKEKHGAICCVTDEEPYDAESDTADAKLIAAAPDLLEAVNDAILELEQCVPIASSHVLNKLKYALNKAL